VSFKSIGLSEDLHRYLVAHNGRPDPLVDELVATTRSRLEPVSNMQIAPEQAPFLGLLVALVGARTAVEVGTFTGLSALAIARALPADGRLICCDVSTEYTDVAREFWARAGVADRIDLRIAPAARTLAALPAEPHVDFAFIDADKTGYPTYWAELVPRMRPGGVLVVDNVLRGGRVLAPRDADDEAIIAFNDLVAADARVDATMIPLADGLTVARVR
jgi:caffeoyl-CoA O-methyltransferase